MSAFALCVVVATILFGLAVIGLRAGGYLGGLFLAQAIWFAMSYVVRPLFLLTYTPTPRLNDPIADPRLAALGYEDGLQPALTMVALFLGVYVFCVWLGLRLFPAIATRKPDAAGFLNADGYCLLAVGWVGRVVELASGSTIAETIGFVGSVGAGMVILRATGSTGRRRLIAIVVVLTSEIAWSLLATTKAPIFACLLWAFIVLVARRKLRLRQLVALCLGAALTFGLVQGVKASAGGLVHDQRVAASYPPAARILVPFVQRFDLISATLDAYLAGPGSWMSPLDATQRLAESLVPTQLSVTKSGQAGADWAIHVRALTVDDSNTGVHLAEGPIAEGFVVGGAGGALLECVLLGLIVMGVARSLRSDSAFWAAIGLMMTSQPMLFERGMLGLGEGFGKALQVAVVVWVVLLFRRSLSNRNRSERVLSGERRT